MTLALLGRAKSASVHLKFATSDKPHLDPTYAAFNGPISFWAKLAFGASDAEQAEMQRAWQRQVPRLGRSGKPWQAVAGPAGATTMVMRNLGWQATSAFRWILGRFGVVDVRDFPPHSLKTLLWEAVKDYLWKDWAEAPSAKAEAFSLDPGGYYMAEVRRWCQPHARDWSALNAACTTSIVCGGQWGQRRLYEAGFVDTWDWQACSGSHPGTVQHRTWHCKALDNYRQQGISREMV